MIALLSLLAALALAGGGFLVVAVAGAALLAGLDRLTRGSKRPCWVTYQQSKTSRTRGVSMHPLLEYALFFVVILGLTFTTLVAMAAFVAFWRRVVSKWLDP